MKRNYIHPYILPEILAETVLNKNNTDPSKEQQYIQILCNKLMFHSKQDPKFRRQVTTSPDKAKDIILTFFDHWVKGGVLERPQTHQQGREGLIKTLQEIYVSDPEQFEFTASPYIADKNIRVDLIWHYTGERLSPGKASSYYLTQIMRSKFNQLTLF